MKPVPDLNSDPKTDLTTQVDANQLPQLIVIMGVSGTGKSSIAQLIAARLNITFVEADDFHDDYCKTLMANGYSLTDELRQAWFERLTKHLTEMASNSKGVVLAFSGLKRVHRNAIFNLPFTVSAVMLKVGEEQLTTRLNNRRDHFVDSRFLAGQLRAMEELTSDEQQILVLENQNITAKHSAELLLREFISNSGVKS